MLTMARPPTSVPRMCVCLGVGEVTLLAIIGGGIVKACHWCVAKVRS